MHISNFSSELAAAMTLAGSRYPDSTLTKRGQHFRQPLPALVSSEGTTHDKARSTSRGERCRSESLEVYRHAAHLTIEEPVRQLRIIALQHCIEEAEEPSLVQGAGTRNTKWWTEPANFRLSKSILLQLVPDSVHPALFSEFLRSLFNCRSDLDQLQDKLPNEWTRQVPSQGGRAPRALAFQTLGDQMIQMTLKAVYGLHTIREGITEKYMLYGPQLYGCFSLQEGFLLQFPRHLQDIRAFLFSQRYSKARL